MIDVLVICVLAVFCVGGVLMGYEHMEEKYLKRKREEEENK